MNRHDYEGRRECDPQCAPDDVDTVTMCKCEGCDVMWPKAEKKKHCPKCQWSVRQLKAVDVYRELEVPA